jgi:hypothetical protein
MLDWFARGLQTTGAETKCCASLLRPVAQTVMADTILPADDA